MGLFLIQNEFRGSGRRSFQKSLEMAFFAGVGLYYSTFSKCRAANPIPRLVDVHPLAWFFREYSMSVELVFREAERSASRVQVQELKSLCGVR